MPIEALPQSTIRAIGSSAVISDPCSIVKELLDNALDASASSIVIEVSPNTLDAIQVKDNGHGIPAEDHAFVCKRTFTSKIHTVDDLKNIGGKYLGFRGEALASAAEMSSTVTVLTRVETELAGSSIKYGRNGELISTQRAPHPVGTTVRISDFLKYIPVRRQTALKNASKNLARIKKMVQAYAMSQPSKRLSLKVLRAKTESNNWVYGPGPNATFMDAALKVAGAGIASSCTTKHWPSENDAINGEQLARKHLSGYKLTAVLPKDDADFSRLSNGGQYFGVDGRPLSTTRGIGRDIAKLYKSYLRAAVSRSEQSSSISDPFFCLHIQCPYGTYDVNIEPAKDDLLFGDPQLVLSLVESMLQDSYGDITGSDGQNLTPDKVKSKESNNNGFELLLSRKSPVTPTLGHRNQNGSVASAAFLTPPSSLRSPSSTGLFNNNVHEGELHQSKTPLEPSGTRSSDLESLNPWVITRMNVPNSQLAKTRSIQNENRRFSPPMPREESTQLHRNINKRYQQPVSTSALASPISTAIRPSATHHIPSRLQIPTQYSTTLAPDSSKKAMRERDKERYGNGSLDTMFEKTTRAALLRDPVDIEAGQEQADSTLAQLAGARFGSQGQHSSNYSYVGTILVSSGCISDSRIPLQSQSQSNASEPRLIGQIPETSQMHQESAASEKLHNGRQPLPLSENNTGLNDALDFERRKKEAIQRRREQMRDHLEFSVPTSSPHRSRYLAAKASLTPKYNSTGQNQNIQDSDENASWSTLTHGDPRAYLMRQRNVSHETRLLNDGNKVRTQTRKLPFEKIPEGYDLHDVSVTAPAKVSQLSDAFTQALATDLYTQSGADFQALPTPESEGFFQLWKGRLSALINNEYRTKDGSQEPNLQFDFSAISQHFNDFNEDGDSLI